MKVVEMTLKTEYLHDIYTSGTRCKEETALMMKSGYLLDIYIATRCNLKKETAMEERKLLIECVYISRKKKEHSRKPI